MKKSDVLIIGSGIAGLTCALHLVENTNLKVILISKDTLLESNTRYAQGGIAAALYRPDDLNQHLEDTLIAGASITNIDVAREVVKCAPIEISHLLKWGVEFDLDPLGQFDLSLEGGHCRRRILHNKDHTGLEIVSKLLDKISRKNNIQLLENTFARDLFCDNNGEIIGAQFEDIPSGNTFSISSSVIILATGGVGQIYQTTSNPVIATGDGIALANKIGAKISGMEFIQFHPTALYSPLSNPSFLISEALRGDGAQLLNIDKTCFMDSYHHLGDLAPRDIVSKAIWEQCKIYDSDFLYLSCKNISSKLLKEKYPTIFLTCKKNGISLPEHFIPITPAAHYLCGGVISTLEGKTNIDGLYVLGESANTGLHGANRLASNSLLEALVMARKCANRIKSNCFQTKKIENSIKSTKLSGLDYEKQKQITSTLKHKMQKYAGIVKTRSAMKSLLDWIYDTQSKVSCNSSWIKEVSLANQLIVSKIIIEQSLERTNSIGCFQILD